MIAVPAAIARETIVVPFNDPAALDAALAANSGAVAAVMRDLLSPCHLHARSTARPRRACCRGVA